MGRARVRNICFNDFNATLAPDQGRLSVRIVTWNKLKESDFKWLSADRFRTIANTAPLIYGVDTEFDNQKVALIQISGPSRCLLIKILKWHRIPEVTIKSETFSRTIPSGVERGRDILKNFMEDPHIFKCGAELWQDALLIYKDLDVKMNGGYDATVAFNNGSDPFKKGLFEIINSLIPELNLNKNKQIQTSKWDNNGNLTKEQIRYAALDALISYQVGKLGWTKVGKVPSIQMTKCPNYVLNACQYVSVTKHRVDDLSRNPFVHDFDSYEVKKQGTSIELKQSRFITRLWHRYHVTITMEDGTKV